jgi:kynurenine formamidase
MQCLEMKAPILKNVVLNQYRAVDLTHDLHDGVPTWSGGCGFRLELKLDYPEGLRVQNAKHHAGVGTHMDAPSHFIELGLDISDIPLENLIIPACVIDLSSKRSPNLLVSTEDLKTFEKRHGKIPKNSLFAVYTGWDEYWTQPLRYRNPDEEGKMHFPGFSADAAQFLVEREVAGIGIDTLSPDGSNEGFPVHLALLGAKKYILENLANLIKVPPVGAYIIAFPMKVLNGTEAVARVAALIESR